MNKKHWKITLISILIASTLFNTSNETVADTSDDIDGSYQEDNDIDDAADASAEDDEVNTDLSYEAENMPVEESPEVQLYDEAAGGTTLEESGILVPADPVEEDGSEAYQEEPVTEEPVIDEAEESETPEPEAQEDTAAETPEPEAQEDTAAETPEDDALDEESEVAGENDGSSVEAEGDGTLSGDDADDEQGYGEEETEETPIPDDQTPPENGQPDQDDQNESDEEAEEQLELPTEEAGPDEPVEDNEYEDEPAEEQPVHTDDWNGQEYTGEDADGDVSEEARSNVAGKKLYRYNYGDILNGLNFSPGNSDESFALLDQRVNRIMTSKILEEDEMSEEEVFSLEQEIKNETSNTSSDRESLPNTGDANNYNYLYSLMLVLAGGILFFITKKPRQQ